MAHIILQARHLHHNKHAQSRKNCDPCIGKFLLEADIYYYLTFLRMRGKISHNLDLVVAAGSLTANHDDQY